MKLLLLGGNGQVGRELRHSLAPLGELVVATREGGAGDVAADFDAPESLAALVAGSAPDGGANARQHPGLVLRDGVEQGGGEHVAGHPTDGVEVDLHPGARD